MGLITMTYKNQIDNVSKQPRLLSTSSSKKSSDLYAHCLYENKLGKSEMPTHVTFWSCRQIHSLQKYAGFHHPYSKNTLINPPDSWIYSCTRAVSRPTALWNIESKGNAPKELAVFDRRNAIFQTLSKSAVKLSVAERRGMNGFVWRKIQRLLSAVMCIMLMKCLLIFLPSRDKETQFWSLIRWCLIIYLGKHQGYSFHKGAYAINNQFLASNNCKNHISTPPE